MSYFNHDAKKSQCAKAMCQNNVLTKTTKYAMIFQNYNMFRNG